MASSDIIKIGFDYRSSLAQFEKDTNGVFDGISSKAGKQKITIQLDAKDDKVIDKIKELQKLKLDKFTFEFGNSGLKEQLQTFDKLENKINEIINLSKGIGNSSAPIVDVNKSSKEIDKLENKISELNKKYDELQKKSATGGISGKEVNLVDNDEFKKLSQEVSELKDQFDDLKTHMSLLDDYTVPTDRFFELQTQVEATSVKVSNLVDEMTRLSNVQKNIGVETNISLASDSTVEQQIKSESELNAEIEKRENIIKELQQLQEKLTVHEDFHGNDRYFADQLPTEEEIREADKRIKQLTGTNNIFNVDKLIQDRNEWLSEVKYSLEEYDDLIKANDQKALDEYTTRGLSRIGGAESFFGYEDNSFSIASKFVEEKEKIQNEINDLYIDLDKLDEKMNLDSNNSSVDNTIQSQEKLRSELKETQKQAEKTAQAVKKSTATASTEQKKDAFPSTGTKLDEAVASAKDLDKTLEQVDIPTDSFNEVLKKLNLTKSELVDIVKITEKSSADKDGKFHTSYTLKDSRGSTEIYGINSKTDKGQLLDHNIVRYDVKKDTVDNSKELLEIEKQLQKEIESSDKANQKKFQDFQKEQANYEESVNKVNSAIQKTDQILDTLPLHDKLDIQFLDMIDSIDNLNSKLKSGELTLSEYKNEVKSVTSEYSKMVDIQQKRDVDEYNANAKANAEAAKLAEAKAKSRQADKDSTQSSVDKALKEQVAAWKNIQSIREKISKTNDSNEIANLQQVKKEYQQNYIEADKILKANSSLYDKENQIAKLEQIRLDTNKKIADYQNKQISGYDTRLEAYTKKTSGYDATIARFKDGGWTSDAYLKNVQAVKNAVDEYETLLKELKGKDASLVTSDDISRLDNYEKKIKDTIATVTNMSASEKGYNFVSGQKELDKIHKLLAENSKMSSEAKAKIRAYYAEIESGNPSMSLDKIHGEILKIYNAEVEAGRAGKTLWDTLKNSGFHQIAAQMAGMFGVYDVINLGKQAFSTVKELDYALVDLKKTTAMNSSELEQFYYDSNDVAKQMGVTTKEIIDQASSWSRLGYNSKQAATEMAKLSSQFAIISPGMDTTTSQEGLVSIMKAWDIGYQDVKSQIMDDINALGNAMAEDNQDIVEGMERSAAALAAVGTSTKDAFALFSGIQEVLQNSEKSGTSLRSVALRLRSFDESTEEYSSDLANITGELADLTKTAEHAQGVSVFKPGSTTEFKSLVDYFREIADIWDEMSQKQQNDFLLKAFGRTQAQAGAALIQNFKGVEKALNVMDNAAGSADKEMETAKQSITYKLNELKQTWVGTVQDIANRKDLSLIMSGLSGVSKGLGFVIGKLGLIPSIIAPIAVILGKGESTQRFCPIW